MKFYNSKSTYGGTILEHVKIYKYRFRLLAWTRGLYEYLKNLFKSGTIDLCHRPNGWSIWIHYSEPIEINWSSNP